MKLFGFFLCLLSTNLWAQFSLESLQAEYGQKKSWPIVLFDKDELGWRFARAKAFGDDHKEKRYGIIQDYVQETVGLKISESEASQLEPYLTVLKEGAFALPIIKSHYPVVYKMCAVFPASKNSSKDLENERLLALNDKRVHPSREVHDYKDPLELSELRDFSLLHELSHCLDEKYFPKTFEHEDAHQVHQAEAFAEIHAYYLLRGAGLDLASARSNMRSAYSHYAGGYFAKNPQLGMGHPYFVAAGAIYHLGPLLLKAQVATPDVSNLEASAQELVDREAMDFRGFAAIVKYLEEGEKAVEYYEERVQQWPDLFKEALETLLTYKNSIPQLAESLFEKTSPPPIISDLTPWGQRACQLLNQNKKSEFMQFLNEKRDILEKSQDELIKKRDYKKRLDEIYESCAY